MKGWISPDPATWRGPRWTRWLVAAFNPVLFGILVLFTIAAAVTIIAGISTVSAKVVVAGIGELLLASVLWFIARS